MRRLVSLGGRKGLVGLLALLALAAGAWLNRGALLRWYYLRQLAAAGPENRETWAGRVAGLGEAVLPGLLECLTREDVRTCANAEAALARLARGWGPADARTLGLVERLCRRFSALSGPGREAGLELALVLLRPDGGRTPAPAPLAEACGKLLTTAAPVAGAGVRVRALALAEVLAEGAPERRLGIYRELITRGLAEDNAECRVRAIHLALHSALRKEDDLLARMVPLLRDSRAEVRRAALLAVGLAEQAIAEDDLLPLLHDPDAEVRRLCEAALRGRGLQDGHLRLARLISAPGAEDRLGVLRHLQDAEVPDPGLWLRRLSQDPDPAVRFAAMAAASADGQIDLSDRLLQMRDTDPSPTVRQWAPYFLRRRAR
jgi:HEAT repeat protein